VSIAAREAGKERNPAVNRTIDVVMLGSEPSLTKHRVGIGTEADMASMLERYDPFSPEVMANPLPFYAELRDRDPVHYLPAYDTFAISRFEDVWNTLGDVSGAFLSTETSLPSPETLRWHNDGPPADPPTDPMGSANAFGSPVYEEFRHAQGRPLRPGGVRALADFVRQTARGRLGELLEAGRFDLTQDYGGRVAASVICRLFGLPTAMADDVLHVVNSSAATHDVEGGGVDKKTMFSRAMEILTPQVARHRRDCEPRSGLIDGLLGFSFGGRELTDDEVAINLVCVFVGGTETVPKVAAHGLWELAKHPDQLAAVRADVAANVEIARDEFVRFCAPAQWFLRTVREPTRVAGTPMRPGQRVMCLVASAARDEREYANPEEFHWDRRIERSVSFGRGQHFCIGYHLARLEVAILAEEFLTAVDDYEVDASAALRPPSSFQWGWTVLPVEVTKKREVAACGST
jgi:cytochrome P450